MKKYLFSFIILGIGIISSVFIIGSVMAQTTSEISSIQYPVKELDDCTSEKECKVYCDKTENINGCLSFAEENDLMSEEEIKLAKNFTNKGMKGPGGCNGKNECDAYCNSMDNMDECISFAEKNNLIPENELKEAKKVQAAIKRGVKPPACGNKNACDAYCEEANHMEECINFGVEAGFIQGQELENAQKMLSALKRGIKPPSCKGKDACDEYCGNPDNMEICMNFAMEAGMMGDSEKKDAQKMLQAIKKGVKPPNCKGKEECDAYCQSEEHMDECINFSVAAGMMDEKQAEMAKKTRGKGPGGCMGKEECEAFCNNPDNQETCFQFGKENGMIPEEDLQKMEQEKANFKENFTNTMSNAPMKVKDCLISNIGNDKIEMFKSGMAMPPREMGDQMKNCFERYMPMSQETQKLDCESNPEECQKFQPGPGITNPGGQMMPQQASPGGCKTQEDCQRYCESNPEQCKNFSSEGGQPTSGMGMEGQQPILSQPQIEMQQQINQQTGKYIQQIQQNMPQFPEGQQPMDQQFQSGLESQQPIDQQFQQGQQPLPGGEQPQSKIQKRSLFGSVISAFLSLFK